MHTGADHNHFRLGRGIAHGCIERNDNRDDDYQATDSHAGFLFVEVLMNGGRLVGMEPQLMSCRGFSFNNFERRRWKLKSRIVMMTPPVENGSRPGRGGDGLECVQCMLPSCSRALCRAVVPSAVRTKHPFLWSITGTAHISGMAPEFSRHSVSIRALYCNTGGSALISISRLIQENMEKKQTEKYICVATMEPRAREFSKRKEK